MIRRARMNDAAAIAEVEVETWRTAYAGILDDRLLLALSPARQARRWQAELRRPHGAVRVWDEPSQGVTGFAHGGALREALAWDAEVFMLYVHPDAQGRGIGRALLQGLFEDFLEDGRRSVLVWVLANNPARFFYQRMGARLALQRDIPFYGRTVAVLGYSWSDVSPAPPGPPRAAPPTGARPWPGGRNP